MSSTIQAEDSGGGCNGFSVAISRSTTLVLATCGEEASVTAIDTDAVAEAAEALSIARVSVSRCRQVLGSPRARKNAASSYHFVSSLPASYPKKKGRSAVVGVVVDADIHQLGVANEIVGAASFVLW